MAKRVLSIQTGIWWTKVALMEYGVKHPRVFDVFTFRTPDNAVEDGYIRERESLANQLRAELSKRKISERKVIFSINSAKVVSREVMVPKVNNRQLKTLAIEQARENFPMDIASYTISFAKMGMLDGDPKTQIKLLLLAVPDNLLSNYVAFAELAGLDIETFEYMGNCAMQFIAKNFIEDAVIVQLEERSTIVSVVKNNKLVFQRVAPHGFDSTLAAAIDHPVLGLRDDQQAFDFLCTNNVTRDKIKPEAFSDSVIVDLEERTIAIQQAYEAIKESMDYHVRIVVSALEFYQNQYKTPLRGTLHLIGDGMRIQGMAKYFDSKINIEVEKGDYLSLVKMDKKTSGTGLQSGEALGLLSILGAVLEPMGITPKELADRSSKRNTTKITSGIFLFAALVSVCLVGFAYWQKTSQEQKQKELRNRIQEMQPVKIIYDENVKYRNLSNEYVTFDNMTASQSEQLYKLVTDLETLFPTFVTAVSFQGSDGSVAVNIESDIKMSAAQLIMNLKTLDYVSDINIPVMNEVEKVYRIITEGVDEEDSEEHKVMVWAYTITFKLKDAPLDSYKAQ